MRVKQVFNEGAKDYDLARRQLIPCFDEFYGTALELIPFRHTDNIQVLDLGAGTGLFSFLVSQFFTQAELTLCDISDAMLDIARERFSHHPKPVKFVVENYADDPITGQYDLIISALSIHHLNDHEKERLFPKIYAALKPNGIFINADQALGETPNVENRYRNVWLRQVKEKGVSDQALDAALERMKEDKMSTLQSQLQYMKNAGFSDVNNWYKNYSFVVYSGTKDT